MEYRHICHAANCPAVGNSPHAICTCGAWKMSVVMDLAQHENRGFEQVDPGGCAPPISVGKPDPINPSHYKGHPSGVECIQITEHMNFNLGNAVKYVWRADEKGDALENLRKARWYLDREIALREKTRHDVVQDLMGRQREKNADLVKDIGAWKAQVIG